MNLFVTDEDPVLSARALDDKRVGKLLMEANQMLSLAVKLAVPDPSTRRLRINEQTQCGLGQVCCGLAHRNHPVSIWVRETRENFLWTARHAQGLAEEFEFRFGKPHASACRTERILQFQTNVAPGELQPFQNSARNASLGVDFSWIDPVTEAYRQYLLARWPGDTHAPRWTRRGRPSWA